MNEPFLSGVKRQRIDGELDISSGSGPITTISNAGPGISEIVNGTGPNLSLKSFTAGTNIDFTGSTATDIKINSTGGGGGFTLQNAGTIFDGEPLLNDSNPSALEIYRLQGAGSSEIQPDPVNNRNFVYSKPSRNYVGAINSLMNEVSAEYFFKGISPSGGVTISEPTTGDLVIFTKTVANHPSVSEFLVETTGTEHQLRGLFAGAGIVIDDVINPGNLTIASTAAATTLANAGAGQSIVANG